MTAPATSESGLWGGRLRAFRALGDCRLRLRLRHAHGSRKAGLSGGRRRCRFTPQAVRRVGLPLRVGMGSPIETAPRATEGKSGRRARLPVFDLRKTLELAPDPVITPEPLDLAVLLHPKQQRPSVLFEEGMLLP
jgi:hypothetical protein